MKANTPVSQLLTAVSQPPKGTQMKPMQERSFTLYEVKWLTDKTNAFLDWISDEFKYCVSELRDGNGTGTDVANWLIQLAMRVRSIENFQNILIKVNKGVSDFTTLEEILELVGLLERANVKDGRTALLKARFHLVQFFAAKAKGAN